MPAAFLKGSLHRIAFWIYVLSSFGKLLSGLHSSQMLLAEKRIRFIVYESMFPKERKKSYRFGITIMTEISVCGELTFEALP